jgi:hypothetical protein
VNPRNGNNLLGVAQLLNSGRPGSLGSFVSLNGGNGWHDNGPLPLPSGYTGGDDISAAWTSDGTGLVAAEAYAAGGSAILVWRTLDGGRTFAAPKVLYAVIGSPNTDHPWIAASPVGKRVYVAWSRAGTLYLSRSVDGGAHFMPARTISPPYVKQADLTVVTAGKGNAVHVVFAASDGGRPFEMLTSRDGGQTFAAPTGPPASQAAAGPSVAVSTLLASAVDPSSGTCYVARAVYRSAGGHLAIRLWRSTDGGMTWKRPVWVDTRSPAAQADQFQPQLAWDSHRGIDVSYFALANGKVDVYLTRSAAGTPRFDHALRVTSAAFDVADGLQGGKGGGASWFGDYQGLAAGTGTVYPFWNDGRSGRLEIYVARVSVHSLGG